MEPERRIEKWLRAFAKKRRERAGGSMELNPAARQRLQREIARRAEEKNRGGFFSQFLASWRLRIAFAVCFIALAIGAWFLIPQLTTPPPATLSMNNAELRKVPKDEAATPPPPAITPAPITAPPAAGIAPVAGEDKKLQPQTPPTAAPTPQPTAPTIASFKAVPPPPETTKQDRSQSALATKEASVTSAATSAPAAPAPATNMLFAMRDASAADSLTVSGAMNKDSEGALRSAAIPPASNFVSGKTTIAVNQKAVHSDATLKSSAALASNTAIYDAEKTALATTTPTASQVFNRLEATPQRRIAGTAGTPAPVLTSFRVEQTGYNMKVVDADGSVYTGSVQIAQQEPASDSLYAAPNNAPANAAASANNRANQALAQQNYFFRVAGTNRNLKQNIVFSGNFVPLTNSRLAGNASGNLSYNSVMGGGGGGGGPVGFGGRPVGGVGGAPAGFSNSSTTPSSVETPLLNSGINGTVTIGNQKAIDVIATPAP